MKQSQGFRDFYILLHSSVYFSQPTYPSPKKTEWFLSSIVGDRP
ncbi:hypothetical protein [Nostoc sp.]